MGKNNMKKMEKHASELVNKPINETQQKCFRFNAEVNSNIEGFVSAENITQAKKVVDGADLQALAGLGYKVSIEEMDCAQVQKEMDKRRK